MIKKIAVALAIALVAGIPFASGAILKNDDGSTEGSFSSDEGPAARFFPKSKISLKEIDVYLNEPLNPFYLHLWPDDGNNLPDTTTDLIEPVYREPGSGLDMTKFDPPIEIDEEIIYVGLIPSADVITVETDVTINCRFPNLFLEDGDWQIYEDGDFAIRVYFDRLDEEQKTFFEDVTKEFDLEGFGGRMAWGDFDNDGFEDLCTAGLKLFINDDGKKFVDVTELVGLLNIPSNGCLFADINNDGHLDIFAQNGSTEDYDRVLINNGDGTFTDETLNMISEDELDYNPTEGAAFGDFNNDGFIDIYLANYELPVEPLGQGTQDRLYMNVDGKEFVDVATDVGMDEGAFPKCGRGANFVDFDNDGDLDLFVSNYRLDPNFLYVNQGDGTFKELAQKYGVQGVKKSPAYYGHTIGSVFSDFDNDGDFDLFSANLAHPWFIDVSDMSMLFENEGASEYKFVERTCESGIFYEETHSHPAAADINNDGDLDLFITSVYDNRYSFFFIQTEPWKFVDYTYEAGTIEDNGWGAAFCDFDNDGKVDLISRKLYHNTSAEGHWLEVKLIGTKSNRAAIGAKVLVKSGDLELLRYVSGGFGTGCQDSMVLHFGIGDKTKVDEVKAVFPSGIERTLKNINADQRLTIMETDEEEEKEEKQGCGCSFG